MANFSSIRFAITVKSIFIALCIFGTIFTSTEACNGYKMIVKKLESCDGKGTLKFTNPKAELTKDCHLLVSGCADLTAAFSSCKIVYDIKKKGMPVPIKGEMDGCEKIAEFGKKPDVARRMDHYKVSKKCPVAKVKACAPKGEKIDFSSFKDKLSIGAGVYTGTLTFKTNSGSSCFKFEGELKR